MKWIKLKNLFCPDHESGWMVSHAANPFAVPLNKNSFRVYFTCRDTTSRSHIGSVDIDFANGFKISNLSKKPVLAPGDPGMFDDSGVAMGYLLPVKKKLFLYYLGWNLKVTVPWLNTIGLAVWNEKEKKFKKHSRAPVMDRSDEDPFSISYPSILLENNVYRMWYGSNLSWGKDQSEMQHVIRYAESTNGIQWNRSRKVIVPLQHPGEYALSKPFVIKENSMYKMWYSYRANKKIKTYRIGYAESRDGMKWKRKDESAGIDVSASGWDSEMICYPFVFSYHKNKYMLYNGNGYGKTGFGIAILDQ
ncbi:MAG: hypothetical protein NT126_07610 [Bacteroidetes bacterium]|nr:hypothetical protein [Bacteroidota bacterium]